MSGIRTCGTCGELFRIENDGPEAMRSDGTFPRHECRRCHYLMVVLAGLSDLRGAKRHLVKLGTGPRAQVVMPHEGQEARVLSIWWVDKSRVAADVCEEESGKTLHDKVLFEPGKEEALGPLLDAL